MPFFFFEVFCFLSDSCVYASVYVSVGFSRRNEKNNAYETNMAHLSFLTEGMHKPLLAHTLGKTRKVCALLTPAA